jgi:hypothetical protein
MHLSYIWLRVSTCLLVGQVSSKHKHSLSRKDARKQERQAKKQRKATNHNVKRHLTTTEASIPLVATSTRKRAASGAGEGESATKKRRISFHGIPVSSPGPPSKPSRILKQPPADAPAKNKLGKSSKRPSHTIDDILPSINLITEDQDDREIARLESFLGLSKKKGTLSSAPLYGAEFAEDGLDGAPAHSFYTFSKW